MSEKLDGGAGLLGCLEAGCSVVALCFDDHHREHLSRLMTERAVESMVAYYLRDDRGSPLR